MLPLPHTMKHNRLISIEVLLIILLVIGIAGSLQQMELRAEEPRRAIVAMEMMLGKNYTVPKIFGANYYNKPPLFNWVLSGMFTVSGSFGEVWVRLPSILSLFITALIIYAVVKNYYNKRTAFIAALLLVFAADIFFYGAVDAGEIDLFLTLLLCVQGLSIFYFSIKQQWWQAFIISYVFMAAGVLTKGLPLVVIQGLLLLCWLVYIKQFRKLFSIQHIVGLVIGIAIIYAYFFAYSKQQDVLLFLAQLLTESAQRSALNNKFGAIALNILQAPLQLFYLCLPATALLLYACNKKVRSLLKGDKFFAFSLMFTLIICALFFLSPDTANRYLYPVFPFIAIMAAIIHSKATEILAPSKWLISYKGLLGIFMFFAVVRIGYDVWGIPYQQKVAKTNYRPLSDTLLQHSGNSPIYLTGMPEPHEVHSFLFLHPKQQSIGLPPTVPYQLPYYLTKATNTIMRYDSIPQKGLYYLAPADFIKDKQATIYFTFFDTWVQRNIVLVKF